MVAYSLRGCGLKAAAALVALSLAVPAQATYKDLIGFPELEAYLGASIPTGAGITVSQVENADGSGNYMPSVTQAELASRTIINVTNTSNDALTHATNVARNFYGVNTSIAPNLGGAANPVYVYRATHWTADGFLQSNSNLLPSTHADSRITNHSWTVGGSIGELLRRMDFIVERDDNLQIVGIPNSNNDNHAGWKNAYNVISVGRVDGNHHSGTLAVDSVYGDNRVTPTLVTPAFNAPNTQIATSWATAMVSAASALLLEVGANSALSNGDITNRTRTIPNAQASEVVKAVLMAGADRHVINARGVDLTTYTVNTSNNLDSHYGAGQLNIYNSYRILAGGEQDAGSNISRYGWDYNPAFGGANSTATTASYYFTPTASWQNEIIAALVWNLKVDITPSQLPFGTASFATAFYDLNLELIDLNTSAVLASSMSTEHNTENIWYSGLIEGNPYELRVTAAGPSFDWDYALAWQVIPEPGTLTLLVGSALLILRRRAVTR
jgi:hypothetical protein